MDPPAISESPDDISGLHTSLVFLALTVDSHRQFPEQTIGMLKDVEPDPARRSAGARAGAVPTLALADVATRIDLLVTSVFGVSYPIRVSQAPAPPTLLTAVFGRRRGPVLRQAIPATDGASLWLPGHSGIADTMLALKRYQAMALQQAMRAERGSAGMLATGPTALHRDVYLLVEAFASDEVLARLVPGLATSINELRRTALAARPLMSAFPKHLRRLETFVRILLRCDCRDPVDPSLKTASPVESAQAAERVVAGLMPAGLAARIKVENPLLKDAWTGELLAPQAAAELISAEARGR